MERRRTGRRPGPNKTRAAIVAAARRAFERDGYVGASVRQIAREAGVDPALIRKFYGDKHGLFLAVARVTYDADRIVSLLTDSGSEGLGYRLVATATRIWESPAGAALVAAIKASPKLATAMVGHLAETILVASRATIPGCAHERRLRVALVEVQLGGLFVTRYLLKTEPIVSLERGELVRAMAPIVQHLMTGPIIAGNGVP